ncbi:SDR family NAD(P)-dependent oxidoreductase [Caulobacter sp. KR2-114]|uniref:SDR family NAD(P)-dependent oxidoreductase n=1 Tax=Caulobacter sp. KR2-114 TaxID=3400912 RepID=UPI003C0287BF
MDLPLKQRVAVVTGASSGLGLHFAKVLAAQGAAVALMARRVERMQDAVGEIRAAGGRAEAFALDVADVAAIGPALDQAQAALGPLSIMINNAGVGGEGLALEVSQAVFDDTFAVNVRGVLFGAREAARRMLDNGEAAAGHARILNIASIGAHSILPGLAIYCASKAAVAQMTRVLAREWARQDIAVNALCPGYIETELNAHWFASEGGQKQLKGWPRRRLMDAEDLDAALLMLTGPGARHITGSVITLDDGQTL